MAASMPWYACLLATMIVAGAMPFASASDLESGSYGPACSRSKDDNGGGGTHVTCRYSCHQLNEIGIGVLANDKDAAAYGDTECGGAPATCSQPVRVCVGVSPKLTEYVDDEAKCHGNSDEIWDSPVTVACFSTGGDASDDLCNYSEWFCPPPAHAHSSEAGWTLPQALAFCLAEEPGLASLAETLVGVLAGVAGPFVSLTGISFTGSSATALQFTETPSGPVCTMQSGF